MNILLLCNGTDGTDGWSTYSLNLQNALKENGHVVHTMQLGDPIRFLTNPLVPLLSAYKAKKTLQEYVPDIVHITVEPYAMILPFLNKAVAARTLLTIHGSYGVRPLLHMKSRMHAKYYYQYCGACIAVSNYTKERVAEELAKLYGESFREQFLQKTHVIHNSIVVPNQKEQSRENATKHIICVGGVKPRKGILEALDACNAYRNTSDTPFHFTIIGSYKDDAYTKHVLKKVHDLNLQNYVTLAGKVSADRLRQYYEHADLYLMPAKTTRDTFEGFGLVYLEANAYGIPCIGPDDSGAAEAIQEGVSGFTVDPKDAERIARRMHQILDKGGIQAKKCREWAKEHDQKGMYKNIESIYAMLHSAS